MEQGRVWADFGAQICCNWAALSWVFIGMVTCKVSDFFKDFLLVIFLKFLHEWIVHYIRK